MSDEDPYKDYIAKNHIVSMLVKEGKELLERDNQINTITLAQFQPFIELFNGDVERMKTDYNYRMRMNTLYRNYRFGLGINIYEPTLVVASATDSRPVYFLDRIATRLKSADPEGNSHKNNVPSAVSPASGTTREQLLIDASTRDVLEANVTEEQKEYFRRVRVESALINQLFVERNMSPEKRKELLESQTSPSEASGSDESGIYLIDDDD